MAPSVSELTPAPVENVVSALKAATLDKKVDVRRLSGPLINFPDDFGPIEWTVLPQVPASFRCIRKVPTYSHPRYVLVGILRDWHTQLR